MGLRVCSEPGCPELTEGRHCGEHAAAHERRRGTRQQRGYDAPHDRLRERWRPRVEAGLVDCHADPCIEAIRRILPGVLWDLGHDRATGQHRGPEHRTCNRSDGGRAAHGG